MVILHKVPSLAKAPRYALLPSDDEDVDIKKLRKNAAYLQARVSRWEQIVIDNMTMEVDSPPRKPVVQKRKKKKKHPAKKPVENKKVSANTNSSSQARAGPSGRSRSSKRRQRYTYKSDGETYFYYNIFEMIFVVSLLAIKRYIGYAMELLFRLLCGVLEVLSILGIFVMRLKDPNWPFYLGMLALSGYIVTTGFIDQLTRLVYLVQVKLGDEYNNLTVEDKQGT